MVRFSSLVSILSGSAIALTGLMLTPSEALAKKSSGTLSQAACSVSQVSGTTASGTVFATACNGPNAGNDTGAQGTAEGLLDGGLFQSFVGSGNWSLGGKSDGGSNNFGFTATQNKSTGGWGFSTPFTGTFALSLKAGNNYSLYLFDNVTSFTQGTFDTIGVALNGSKTAGRDLSHASLFVFNPTQPNPGNNAGQPVPEPLTVLGTMMAAGMGYGIKRKQKMAKQG